MQVWQAFPLIEVLRYRKMRSVWSRDVRWRPGIAERVVGSCEDPLRNRIRETSEGNLPSIKSRRVILKFITFAFSTSAILDFYRQ